MKPDLERLNSYRMVKFIGRAVIRFFDNAMNSIYWAVKMWGTYEWDHAFLFHMMELKLERMSQYHYKYGICVDSKRTAQQLHVASLLCKRLSESYQDDIPNHVLGKEEGIKVYFAEPQRCLTFLCLMMKKHALSWWD